MGAVLCSRRKSVVCHERRVAHGQSCCRARSNHLYHYCSTCLVQWYNQRDCEAGARNVVVCHERCVAHGQSCCRCETESPGPLLYHRASSNGATTEIIKPMPGTSVDQILGTMRIEDGRKRRIAKTENVVTRGNKEQKTLD